MDRPNILYIHSHDTGRHIQPYGHPVSTPNLQRLAEEGVMFRQAFTVNPTCSPSRACLLTGRCAHSNGMLGLAHRGFRLNNYGEHIVHTLKRHGYHSALAGVQHIAHGEHAWKTIGYDRCLGSESAEVQAAKFLSEKHEAPFFLSVGFLETHRKFPEPYPDENPDYCLPPTPLPDTPQTRRDMAGFKQSARALDGKMGVVFDAIEKNGLEDSTLVICTTDHGIAFPRMKCNLEDTGIGVMLIMRGPAGFSGGKVVDAMVSQVDIFPTVCNLLGIEGPVWLEGTSFLPLVNGLCERVREEIFAEINYHASYEPVRAVRTERWKYIRRYDYRSGPVLPNCDAGPSKDLWLANGWKDRRPQEEALYDLMLDPNEMNSLVHNEKYKDVLGGMKRRLHDWMKRTGDPLLAGDLPMPQNALLNPRDDLHPAAETVRKGER